MLSLKYQLQYLNALSYSTRVSVVYNFQLKHNTYNSFVLVVYHNSYSRLVLSVIVQKLSQLRCNFAIFDIYFKCGYYYTHGVFSQLPAEECIRKSPVGNITLFRINTFHLIMFQLLLFKDCPDLNHSRFPVNLRISWKRNTKTLHLSFWRSIKVL